MQGRFTGAAVLLLLVASSLESTDWRAKVDSWVLDSASRQPETEALILLTDQADLREVQQLEDRSIRRRLVVDQLQATAQSTQATLLDDLRQLDIPHRSFWIANMIWVRTDLATIQALAQLEEVARVLANPRVSLQLPEASTRQAAAPQGVEWNLVRIGAPNYWTAGHTGSGVVIAGQDTGYDWRHPALQGSYRGWDGVTADHDYNWHDAIHSVGASSTCGADSPEPCDDHNHGTHTMGIMVGDDGAGNQIGVAPGARWIGCRNMDENGAGTPASYAECFQFFMAPTRVDGSDPDPTRAPHVINNSWTCPPSEGCTDPSALQTVVRNTRAAGIVVVAAAGNSGPSCSSINSPPAIYSEALTVGATDSTDLVWSQSSRGGISVDGSLRLKPDVTAPGVSVRSSVPGGGYSTWSGTSMAAPHVAGQIALLISAVPAMARRPETLESCVEATALPLTDTLDCSGISGSHVPNNSYGRGRVALPESLPSECSADFIFSDELETGDTSSWD